jgi:hypothetical protein
LRTADGNHDVTLIHTATGTGKTFLEGSANKTLDTINDRLMLVRDGSRWVQVPQL